MVIHKPDSLQKAPHTPIVPPTECLSVHGHKPSPDLQNTWTGGSNSYDPLSNSARVKTWFMKTTLLYWNWSLNCSEPSFQHPGVIFPCDLPEVGTHSLFPLCRNWAHNLSVPLRRCSSNTPWDVEEVGQPRQPHNIRAFNVSGWISCTFLESIKREKDEKRRERTLFDRFSVYTGVFCLTPGKNYLITSQPQYLTQMDSKQAVHF